ncbi:MAG: GTP 3',8-cyclase MoaA [Planctomycetota bacterium]
MMPTIEDRFGRRVRNLRISVTDRCNFRCLYCMPEEGLAWLPDGSVLTFDEIERFVRIGLSVGIDKVRLTGGEPTLRPRLNELVARLVALPGLKDLSLTTNGFRLADQAESLAAAGLRRINVSLDSLVKERFYQLTRRDALDRVHEGLRVAAKVFPGDLKVNVVVMRGINDVEILPFAEMARDRGWVVRFIEFMPLDADQSWQRAQVMPGAEILERIREHFPLRRVVDQDLSQPARDWEFEDGRGRIGFINSVSEPFCGSCDRVRLTADGKLRTCLFSTSETDFLELLRNGSSDEAIVERLRDTVLHKEAGHGINDPDFEPASRSMSQIGG